ncbi:hypothetical protein BS47DRAFT_1351875 [Hydnum rufescens UP504]|uniref:Uncharacterized protein n=1 Tax=Hydnum rufescens UP504 TaxID=1448309 RepID=A0A9P6AK38_9AGAM|nr:hypothetical protein BS47DRAFT_1351875 [Hydnum rufescens UP504]
MAMMAARKFWTDVSITFIPTSLRSPTKLVLSRPLGIHPLRPPTPIEPRMGSTDGYSNFGAGPSLSYEAPPPLPPPTAAPFLTGELSYEQQHGFTHQPDLMYLPPALGTTEAPTYAHNPDVEEGDKDLAQFADFGTIAGTSGHATHSQRGPSRKGKPQGKEPQSRRPPKVKGGQRPGPQPTGNKPRRPRTKLHGEEADIARQIARQLLAEVERCDEHHLPDVHRLECGPCYRKKLDRGQKDDRLYVRPELNALVFTATSEGRARSPDRVTTDMSLIPDNLNHLWKQAVGLFAMRVREPRRWKVTRPNGVVVVVREAE